MTDSNLPRIPDAIDHRRLAAMKLVADARAAAGNGGLFVGGFIDPITGETFVMTNQDEAADDVIRQRLQQRFQQLKPDVPPWDDPLV